MRVLRRLRRGPLRRAAGRDRAPGHGPPRPGGAATAPAARGGRHGRRRGARGRTAPALALRHADAGERPGQGAGSARRARLRARGDQRIVPGPAGGFTPSTRTGWIDAARGEASWNETAADGTVIDETLVERSRITRYDPVTRTAVIASSCAALATGCASAVDPLMVYRQALQRVAATPAAPATLPAGRVPVLAAGAGAGRRRPDAQVVTVDARTLLPERIEWRERRPGGRVQTAAVIDIRDAGVARDQVRRTRSCSRCRRRPQSPSSPRRVGRCGCSAPPADAVGGAGAIFAARLARAARRRSPARRDHALPLQRRFRGGLRYGPLQVWDNGPVVPGRSWQIGSCRFNRSSSMGSARVYSTVGGQLALDAIVPAAPPP